MLAVEVIQPLRERYSLVGMREGASLVAEEPQRVRVPRQCAKTPRSEPRAERFGLRSSYAASACSKWCSRGLEFADAPQCCAHRMMGLAAA